MRKNVLWLKNNTKNDVSLGDLGTKIPAGTTINVFAYNPSLTEQLVKQSKESGSIYKRMHLGIVSIVKRPVAIKPHTLGQIKASTEIVKIVKSKSSVFVDTKDEDILDDKDFGDFADYGLGDLGHNNTKHVVDESGAILVEQKKDVVDEIDNGVAAAPENIGPSKQSVVIMTNQAQLQSNPIGNLAQTASDSNSEHGFVVVEPPEQKPAAKKTVKKTTKKAKAKKSGENIVIEAPEAEPTNDVSEPFDVQVATKDKFGSILMKVKEIRAEERKKIAKSAKVKPSKKNK